MTLKQIREDLRAIRYYYTRKEYFDAVTQIVGTNSILEKAKMYNEAVKTAPPKLFDLYTGLYIRGNTQEAFSVELGYTPEYVQMQHKKLLLFLQTKLNEVKV